MEITILLGPNKKQKPIEAFPLLEGLVFHKSTNSPEDDVYTITHKESGLAVFPNIKEANLLEAKKVLSEKNWAISSAQIYEKRAEYIPIIKKLIDSLCINPAKKPNSKSLFLIESKTKIVEETFRLNSQDLDTLSVKAENKNKLPVYILELADVAEVAILRAANVPKKVLAELKKKVVICKNKFIQLTVNDIKELGNDKAILFVLQNDYYLMLPYYKFLELIKYDKQ